MGSIHFVFLFAEFFLRDSINLKVIKLEYFLVQSGPDWFGPFLNINDDRDEMDKKGECIRKIEIAWISFGEFLKGFYFNPKIL